VLGAAQTSSAAVAAQLEAADVSLASAAQDLATTRTQVTTLTAQVTTSVAQVQSDRDAIASTPTSTVSTSSSVRGWTETAWDDASSGCSGYIAKPAWQTDTACPAGRSTADVSAVADPATGLAIYDSYNAAGWLVVGGTSLASPLIAGMLVRSGHASDYDDASPLSANSGRFNDVTSGSNGSCGGTVLCSAAVGYDGPTGVGTPTGLGSF
jgi:hypothetical protein